MSRADSPVEQPELLPLLAPSNPVLVVDAPLSPVHRPDNLWWSALDVVGIFLVLWAARWGDGSAATMAREAFFASLPDSSPKLAFPSVLIETLVFLLVTLLLMVPLVWRRRWSLLAEGAAALVFGIVLVGVFTELLPLIAPASWSALVFTRLGEAQVPVNFVVAALVAFLAALSGRISGRLERWSWLGLAVAGLFPVLSGVMGFPGAILSFVLGHLSARLTRFLVGADTAQASGVDLVEAIVRAGINPVRVVRSAPNFSPEKEHSFAPKVNLVNYSGSSRVVRNWLKTWKCPWGRKRLSAPFDWEVYLVTTPAQSHESSLAKMISHQAETLLADPDFLDPRQILRPTLVRVNPDLKEVANPTHLLQLAAQMPPVSLTGRTGRNYFVWDASGRTYSLTVLDPLQRLWTLLLDFLKDLRFRGLDRASATSVRGALERGALAQMLAAKAQVGMCEFTAISQTEDSLVVLSQVTESLRPWSQIPSEDFSDAMLLDAWEQLLRAHRVGLAHHGIDAQALAFNPSGQARLGVWRDAETSANELGQLVDLAQMLTLQALKVGAPRAVSLAESVLGKQLLTRVEKVLQPVALSKSLRAEAKAAGILPQLQKCLSSEDELDDTAQVELRSYSPKTVLSTILALVVVVVVFGSLSFDQVAAAMTGANPWWLLAAFGFSLLMFIGSAIPLQAFVPEKLGLGESTLVQVAGSVVALVAPAGIGPAALNLRFLSRKKVPTRVAVATVALIQVEQFVVTIVLLVLVTLLTGQQGALVMPSANVLWGGGLILIALLGLTFIGPVRGWLWEKIKPTWEQIWPRLLWLGSHPGRVAYGVFGSVLITVAAVASFGSALAAFGYSLDPALLAITYLVSNSAGALIPTPGGVGPVEAALSLGLRAAGIPASVAVSTALLFRLVTFWARLPLGWLALKFLQKRGTL
ncbi:hypothetical protein BK816_08830 [Boudabousia tangfeifanii]|uniref:TIGR00374 family protein n=1 Tax=Boudabousia tangfeifanii TaxID=1912795 RepID=A0A1D9MLW1_9ACTO|nr:lysylphosphatidylglycerol synthase transmembrane domain-containing protein [Boudabousia tangfeifanii]AOZ73361.1 hypothetical protein BK816_08830 [Boudabousia tangfeifanii]